jgi:hypothetical protein
MVPGRSARKEAIRKSNRIKNDLSKHRKSLLLLTLTKYLVSTQHDHVSFILSRLWMPRCSAEYKEEEPAKW